MIPSRKSGFAAGLLRAAGAILPFSTRGLCLSLTAAALLGAGLVRSDLASLFWGASFLLYALYAIAASHASRLLLVRRARAQPDFLSVILPREGTEHGRECEAHLSARLPRAFAPGFFVRFLLPLSWQEREFSAITCRLGAGITQRVIRFTAPRRGAYHSVRAELEVRDVLGFTVSRVQVPISEALTVHPALGAGKSWRILAEGEDPAATTSRRRRSEELLEVRKYYPGDDSRRLNWKVFAHSGELFLRVGEETPPPQSRLLFILDTTANPLIPRELADEYLDSLVDSCASAMHELAGERITVLLCRPGDKDCRTYVQEERPRLLAALADQWWADGPWHPPLPALSRLQTAVFSTPGSPGLAPILGQIRDRGWSASLFLKEPPALPGPAALRLRDLLFVPAAREGGKPAASAPNGQPGAPTRVPQSALKAQAALTQALARDLSTYGSPAWRVRHAREI